MEENTVEITYDKNFNRNKCIIIFLALLFIQNFAVNASSIQKITYLYVWIHNMVMDPAFVVSSFFLQTFKTILVYLIPFSFDAIIITVTSILYILLLVRACIQKPAPKAEADKILSQVLLVHFLLSLFQGLSFIVVGIILIIFPSIRNDILFLYPVAFDFVTGGVILVWCLIMLIVYRVFKSKKRRKELYGV
ncbi:MAG: hypothetical protein IKS56_04725 [Lachnospiraceae bacterium]|nr:hypothetical protein [Lachnospiraceae bacterium]